jgi:hypothetical protein
MFQILFLENNLSGELCLMACFDAILWRPNQKISAIYPSPHWRDTLPGETCFARFARREEELRFRNWKS